MGALDHGNQKTALSIDCNADILVIEVGHFLVVDCRVHLRVEAQRFGSRLDEERQESEFGVLALRKRILRARTQSGDLGDINFNDRCQLCSGAQ